MFKNIKKNGKNKYFVHEKEHKRFLARIRQIFLGYATITVQSLHFVEKY